ncbi:hypothetical protein [Pseudomonas sp. NPDC096950]|uniref:hypothetical protein n=1 Tax=Pseudomonas sp. NPDC096950 TaxID=3364485 RepID=UPI00383AAF43
MSQNSQPSTQDVRTFQPDLDNLIERLQAIREQVGGKTKIAVAGFETHTTNWLAEADMLVVCQTDPRPGNSTMEGNLSLTKSGQPTVWLGWSQDYRSECFLRAVEDPDEFGVETL